MNSIEKKCKETFIKLLDALASADPELLEKAAFLFHPNYRGYGTSQVEKYTSQENMKWFLTEIGKQLPGGLTYKIHEILFSKINESVIELFAEVTYEMHTQRGIIPLDLMRVTSVLVRSGDHMVFKQMHCSVPDRSAIDEAIVPGSTEPRDYDEVSVLFTDFTGFTTLTSTLPPKKLLAELNDIYANFDKIILSNNLKKIKIIGDAYMAAAGITNPEDHAIAAVTAAKQILGYLAERNSQSAIKWHTRIGIHSGHVIGGVIGSKDLSFDLYGDTVNLTSAIEQAGEAGKINISAYTYGLVQHKFDCKYRGKIEIKDKRMIDMYFVN